MAMQAGTSGTKSDINVTPFVDIVLVLLIIFMVVTPMLSRALDLAVPPKATAETATEAQAADQLILTVRGPAENPRVFLNQEELPGAPDSVGERIGELMKGRREKVVFFQAEDEVPYQYVVNVIDQLKAGGAEKIGLITDETLALATREGVGGL
ncbi:MAG: ExbD/TolR family protein [Acidobacteriota bacterium]